MLLEEAIAVLILQNSPHAGEASKGSRPHRVVQFLAQESSQVQCLRQIIGPFEVNYVLSLNARWCARTHGDRRGVSRLRKRKYIVDQTRPVDRLGTQTR